MKYILDRVIIYALLFYIMSQRLDGTGFLYVFYYMVFAGCVQVYLLYDVEKRTASYKRAADICSVVYMLLSFVGDLFFFIPIAIYDLVRTKCRVLYPLIVIAIANMLYEGDLYMVIVSVIAIVLSTFTTDYERIQAGYKKLRDDDEEQRRKLLDTNRELIQSKDELVYMTQLSERNRIAREIHDNVGHVLSRTILQVGALLTVHKKDPLYEELSPIRENLDLAMNSIRRSVHSIYDESIDLKVALSGAVEPLRREEWELDYAYDASDDIPRNIKIAVIAIVKECVSNAIKHSKSHSVMIRFIEHPKMYQIIVHDRGVKGEHTVIDPYNEGMGLSSIRNRVEELGGNLIISADDGFRVFATIRKEV
jgi:signal transduction histidine kinase